LRRSAWWTTAALAGTACGACTACSGTGSSETSVRDPCAPLGIVAAPATAVERDGIAGALALWRDRGVAAFDPVDAPAPAVPGASLEIRFDDAADVFHGVYDPAGGRVLINRGIADASRFSIVIAHEFGHAFGLIHIAPATRTSLMNPDNLTTPPTEADQRALEAMWGSCR
jgi:hypothetical protein